MSNVVSVQDNAVVLDPAEPPGWVRDYYADVDSGNGAGALARMAPDVEIQFGVRPVVSGRNGAARTLADVHKSFLSVSHQFRSVWQAGDTVICEFVATYRFHDDSLLPLPTLTVLRRSGDQIASMHVYIDEQPLIARSERRRA